MVTYACKFTYSVVITARPRNLNIFLYPSTGPNCHCVLANPTKRNDLISELITGPESAPTFQRPATLASASFAATRHIHMRLFIQSWYAVISASEGHFFNCSKAPKAKSSNASGLGRAIINRRAKDARQTDGSNLVRSGCISIEGSQPCLLVHNRHRSILSFAVCHPGRRSRRILEYGTIGRHRIYCR